MKVVFLDRDGTINVDHGYVHRREDWEFTEHAVDALRWLRQAGFALAVVSNQSGIATGRYTRADVDALQRFVTKLLDDAGVRIDAWAFCPHAAAEDCPCRKPRTGMVRDIERHLDEPIDFARSWTIGDKPSDVLFGAASNMRTVLLTSRYWSPADEACTPTYRAANLFDACRVVTL